MTKRRYHFGLLGHNISSSLSPDIFAAIAEQEAVEIEFSLCDYFPDDLDSAIERLKTLDSFSVTIPHKQVILPHLDQMSETARAIGAVNSVIVRDGVLTGDNTDAAGFIHPLRQENRHFAKILILGNGGAARAVLWALRREYAEADVSVCGRDRKKVRDMIKSVVQSGNLGKIDGLTFDDIGGEKRYDLIVNCTPMGGEQWQERSPLPDSFQYEGQPLCYDLVYRPVKTIFLRRAEKNGCRVMGGISMLVIQAIMSYIGWTGREVDMDDMGPAIHKKLLENKEMQ